MVEHQHTAFQIHAIIISENKNWLAITVKKSTMALQLSYVTKLNLLIKAHAYMFSINVHVLRIISRIRMQQESLIIYEIYNDGLTMQKRLFDDLFTCSMSYRINKK